MSYGELVLVCGDMHVPQRSADIQEQFRTILAPNKMQHILCTGNLTTKDTLDYLRSLAPRVHVVRGDFDEEETLPETKVVTIGGFKIGLCHGHQIAPAGEVEALAGLQRSLDVDVLVTGHTHRTSIAEYDGKCYINPGSLTGAYTPLARATAPAAAGASAADAATAELGLPSNPNPSFMLMNIQDAKIDFFLYELTPEGKLRISKSTFAKAAGSGAGGSSSGSVAKSIPAASGGSGSAGPAGGKTHATGSAGSMAL